MASLTVSVYRQITEVLDSKFGRSDGLGAVTIELGTDTAHYLLPHSEAAAAKEVLLMHRDSYTF